LLKSKVMDCTKLGGEIRKKKRATHFLEGKTHGGQGIKHCLGSERTTRGTVESTKDLLEKEKINHTERV